MKGGTEPKPWQPNALCGPVTKAAKCKRWQRENSSQKGREWNTCLGRSRCPERHTMAAAWLHFLQLASLRLPVNKHLFINLSSSERVSVL